MEKYELTIDNMKCQGCATRISNVLSKIEGVASYKVFLEEKKVSIEVENADILKKAIEKIENLDFNVTLNK